MESQPLDHHGSPSSSFLIWIYFVYFPCLIALAKTPVALLHNIIALPLILEDTFLAFHCGVWHYLSAYKMCLDYVVKYSLGAPPTFCVWRGWRGDAARLVGSQFPKPRPQQWKPGILPTRPPGNSLSVLILKRVYHECMWNFVKCCCWICWDDQVESPSLDHGRWSMQLKRKS